MIKPTMKFHEYIQYGLGVIISQTQIFSITPFVFWQRGLIQKLNYPELSPLLATHCLDMIQPSVKFHEYIFHML